MKLISSLTTISLLGIGTIATADDAAMGEFTFQTIDFPSASVREHVEANAAKKTVHMWVEALADNGKWAKTYDLTCTK